MVSERELARPTVGVTADFDHSLADRLEQIANVNDAGLAPKLPRFDFVRIGQT